MNYISFYSQFSVLLCFHTWKCVCLCPCKIEAVLHINDLFMTRQISSMYDTRS